MTFDSLASITKKLMFKEPFYGYFLLSLNKVISERIPTAGVGLNKINMELIINPKYWDSLTDPVKLGLLKHELLHLGFFHLDLREKYNDHVLFNIAADLEVNQYLDKENCGEGWIYLKDYPELKLPERAGTQEYYRILEDYLKKRQAKGKSNQNMPGQGQGQGQPGQGQPGGSGGKKQTNDPTESGIWDYYDQMQEGKPTICSHETWEEFFGKLSESDKKLIRKQIEYQLKEIVNNNNDKGRGFVPGEFKSIIDSLFEIEEAVVDWKAYLRKFSGYSNKIFTRKTRRKLNKRFSDNPALKIKTKKTILIGRDTSGSVSQADHMEFFNEIHHIWKTGVRIFIADSDAAVATVFEYKGKLETIREIHGGGGTDFDPVIQFYNANKKQFNCLIYLTDGFCTPPSTQPATTMLWVITSNGNIPEGLPGAVVQITK